MLKIFIGFISATTFLFYFAVMFVCIFGGDPGYWLFGIGVFLGYLIGWNISGGVALSPLSHFVLSDWEVFKTKYKYANGIAFGIGFLIYILIELGYF